MFLRLFLGLAGTPGTRPGRLVAPEHVRPRGFPRGGDTFGDTPPAMVIGDAGYTGWYTRGVGLTFVAGLTRGISPRTARQPRCPRRRRSRTHRRCKAPCHRSASAGTELATSQRAVRALTKTTTARVRVRVWERPPRRRGKTQSRKRFHSFLQRREMGRFAIRVWKERRDKSHRRSKSP